MRKNIIEIKARCVHPEKVKTQLSKLGADFKGVDHQIDTYFRVKNGRLKLREGNIETQLIYYQRKNQLAPKASEVILHQPNETASLKQILSVAIGEKVIVDKMRSIYFIDNVKFHIDEVKGLGAFVEIEAINTSGDISENDLLKQCAYYMEILEIAEQDLLPFSYSDMLEQL